MRGPVKTEEEKNRSRAKLKQSRAQLAAQQPAALVGMGIPEYEERSNMGTSGCLVQRISPTPGEALVSKDQR
jgi:hypothetical protein